MANLSAIGVPLLRKCPSSLGTWGPVSTFKGESGSLCSRIRYDVPHRIGVASRHMKEPRQSRKPSLAAPLRWVGLTVRVILGPPARAVRGSARRVADPARQVVDYWGSERRTMRQAFVAVIIASATSLIAGLALAGMQHRMDQIPGLFVLIPVSIGMRGNIFGALAARLGTSIHTGLFDVSRKPEGVLGQNVYGATLLTVATSVAMAVLARAIAALFGIETVSVWDFVVIALVGGILSSAFVLAFTVTLSIESFRRGWDLDSV